MIAVGTKVVLRRDCSLWPGRPGTVVAHHPERIDNQIQVSKADGSIDLSWFLDSEVWTQEELIFLNQMEEAAYELKAAEVQTCMMRHDMEDASTIFVYIDHPEGEGDESHAACPNCRTVLCCPSLSGYPQRHAEGEVF